MTEVEEFYLGLIQQGRLIVYEDGRVFNTVTKHFIGNCVHADGGAHIVGMKVNGKHRAMLKHRLVWLHFRGEIPKNMRVVYKDRHLDDSISNLELAHPADERFRSALPQNVGMANQQSKLTDDAVIAARYAYVHDNKSVSELSKLYGVSKISMMFALRGDRWKHIPGPVVMSPYTRVKKKRVCTARTKVAKVVRTKAVKVVVEKPAKVAKVAKKKHPIQIKNLAKIFLQKYAKSNSAGA